MPMTILKARDRGTDYVIRIHLDPTKLDAEGNPDPDWIREFTFGKQPPAGRTAVQYLADIRREVKALCQNDLTRMQAVPDAGTALPIEGLEL